MKDLQAILGKINLANLNQSDEIVIDEFAKSIIDRVFNNLAIIFPAWKHNWKSDDPSDPDKVLRSAKREWTKAFVENNISTMEQIKYGFAKARKSETDFLPSCGKFISWCEPSAEDLGYPSEQQAMKQCVTYRNKKKMGIKVSERSIILELVSRVDWWLMNNASNQEQIRKADRHFKETYMDLINSGYQEAEEVDCERLETSNIVKDRMSPEQLEDGRKRGLDVLKDVKRKLKTIR